MNRIITIILLACVLTGCASNRVRHEFVLVLRHHPAWMEPEGRMQDKIDDERTIMQALEAREFAHEYSGGAGRSGFSLSISREDLPEWQTMIRELIQKKKLKYYNKFEFDEYGFGLAPIQ